MSTAAWMLEQMKANPKPCKSRRTSACFGEQGIDEDGRGMTMAGEPACAECIAHAAGPNLPNRPPRGFRVDPDSDQLRCPHRDRSCCPKCASDHEAIVEVYGVHYWIGNGVERLMLLDSMRYGTGGQ